MKGRLFNAKAIIEREHLVKMTARSAKVFLPRSIIPRFVHGV